MKITLAPLNDSTGFWIYRVHTQAINLLRRTLQAAGYDLTPEQCYVLIRLGELQGINQSCIGRRLFKDRHSITRILDVLERHGYIERRPDGADKRMFRIFLTERGDTVRDGVVPLVVAFEESVYEGLTEEDLCIMRKMLEHIAGNIEGKAQEPGRLGAETG
ncbi:MAG: MarR family transcriptional regulator [Syntrophorhabdales bacterium]|jgi:DNA-binding MarR family transcriptional regulator